MTEIELTAVAIQTSPDPLPAVPDWFGEVVLISTFELPKPQRRLDRVCAPGYTGRKRGEVVRTRTTVNQAHSFQWLGSFGNRGNGRYREELRRAKGAIGNRAPQPRCAFRGKNRCLAPGQIPGRAKSSPKGG